MREERGWSRDVLAAVERTLVLLLAEHPADEPVTYAQLDLPRGRGRSIKQTAEILAELGLLHEQRPKAILAWIDRRTSTLPTGFQTDVRDWLSWLHAGDARTRPRSDTTLYVSLGAVQPILESWAPTRRHLREVTRKDVHAAVEALRGSRLSNAVTALKSLFRFATKHRRIFTNPTTQLHPGAHPYPERLPLDELTLKTAASAAVTPALRLIVALAAIHAARPQAIRLLTLDDIDLPNRRIILDGLARPLDELTHDALRDYLAERRRCWPHTANPHVLLSRLTAAGVKPVSTYYLKQHLLVRHQVRLDDLRADRVLEEALNRGPDALHLAVVFGIEESTAIRYAEQARRLINEDQHENDNKIN
ncbi:hypothetical protein SAMN05216275_14612 [Streptosporangium canum]|uniref:Core-binding (CB) domain-containing protein n=1 Tax=Streptosporangium canum TaxID=324952 RepID=A0A1I4E1Z7_9ACTN|nr:hypothetical protein [Streptosporangium canum]SFK99782.1 hypothetical protein SAMN05216275_14612 [Streptosporangium canum]